MVVRMVLAVATLAWFLDAVLDHPTPLFMAIGVVPLGWIAFEAVWRLTRDERKDR